MKTFKNSKSAIVALVMFSATILTCGIIYASNEIPTTDPRGCFTNQNNDGHCVHNGNTYFCAEKKFLKRKNCQIAKPKEDETIGGAQPAN